MRKVKAATDEVLAKEFIHARAAQEISEQALLERYAKDYAGKPGPEEINLRLILVGSEPEAKAIIKQLQGGVDFAALAKQRSEDTTASVGGELGWVARTDLNVDLAGAAFAAIPGQLVPTPVKSNGKWFVLKVEGRRAQPTPPFAAVRAELEKAAVQERGTEWTKQALDGAKIRIFTIAGQEIEDLPPDMPASKKN